MPFEREVQTPMFTPFIVLIERSIARLRPTDVDATRKGTLSSSLSLFIVLIERLLASSRIVASLVLAVALGGSPAAQAQTLPTSKIAIDLLLVMAAPTTPKLNWAKDVNGVRYVKVLVI